MKKFSPLNEKRNAFYGCHYENEPDEMAVQQIARAPDGIGLVYFDVLVSDKLRAETIIEQVMSAAKKKWPFATYFVSQGAPENAPPHVNHRLNRADRRSFYAQKRNKLKV